MNEEAYLLAVELDVARAGFTGAEREMFYAAMDKPPADLTDDEWALLQRYQDVRDAA